MTPPAGLDDHVQHSSGDAGYGAIRPGVVAGAVLRAARLSAEASETAIAAAFEVTAEIVRSWENGSLPLASVPYPQVARLETALRDQDADPQLVADLDAAAWCDLVILATAADEDATCLMADPITTGPSFRELLAWSVTGHVPDRYRPYADPRPLVTDSDLARRVTHVLAALPDPADVAPPTRPARRAPVPSENCPARSRARTPPASRPRIQP